MNRVRATKGGDGMNWQNVNPNTHGATPTPLMTTSGISGFVALRKRAHLARGRSGPHNHENPTISLEGGQGDLDSTPVS